MSATEVDYDALAKQYGAASAPPPGADSSVDYDSLAKQFGATPPEAKPEIESSKLPTEVQRAVTSVPRPAPPVGLTPGNRYVAAPNQQSPEVRLGNLLPENSAPALFAAKKYAVDPFEKAAAKGAEAGRQMGSDFVTAATEISHPAYLSATLPSPYGPKPPVRPPEQLAAEEHPVALGIARGIGSAAGSTVTDPRNWPFFASSAARPILQRLISGGFGAQMTAGTIQAAKNLYQNWDSLTPSQRAELATQGGLTAIMAAGSVSHALSPAPDVQPTRAELAEHLDRTNFHSPEALKASWTAEQQSRQAPPETGSTQVAVTKTPTGPTDSIADQYNAQLRRQGAEVPAGPSSVDYDALAREHGAIPSTVSRAVTGTDAVSASSGNRIAPKIDTSPSPAGSAPTSFADRRVNLTERKRIGEMTPEEMRRELLTSPVTGLPNRRAFDEAGPGGALAMSDADGLKAFNDRFGYEAGDALLRAKADALKQAGLTAFHDKGDEFLYRGTSTADLQSKLENARQTFRNMVIEATLPDGTVKYLKGVDFSYGTGKELSDAETALKAHKSEREARGERIRGGLPGVAEVSPGNEVPVPSRQAEASEIGQSRYKNASTQVNLRPEQAAKVKEAGRMIPDSDLAGNGREDQPHITVKYGVNDRAAEILREKLAQAKPFEATLGKIKTFPPTENSDNAAVVHAEVHAPELEQLHKEVAKHVGTKADDFEFRPHVTLAYIRPEVASRYEGRADLEGTKIPIDSIHVSQKNGEQIEIPLGGSRVVPGARSAATGNETGTTTMQDLTDSIRRQVGEKRPLTDRLKTGADIGQTAAGAKDTLSTSWNRLKGGAGALWDAYKRPPKWTDYEDATGKWSGADQANALDLDRFTKAIKDTVPDKLRREAISNWIEAGGDDALLRERAEKSAAPHKAGYEAALSLTDAEKTIARNIMNRNDATLEEAQKAGLLRDGVENYVRHIWADNPKMVSKVMAEMNFNSLQTKPSFTKERKLPTYFDGEQIGLKPKDKDVGFLTASHERAFREALAARAYIKSLMEGKASDGRPLVATSWASAKELPATEGIKSTAYLVKPNITPEAQFADYRPIDHPALRGWRWVGKTETGQPIFVQGDALVHPEIYTKLKNNLGKSAIRSYAMEIGGHTVRPGAAVLNVSSEIKHAILSFSGFHQTTLGIHALEHRTLPAAMPELDLSQPKQRFLVDHGLMVAQYDAAEAFGEGLASGGLVTKIPGIGPAYHTYTDYLFKSYLPRVKMAMALNALERNTRIYGDKLSADQIGALTARQANAAFGGLNYKLLGRNKTLQDVMRLAFMAPDFTEARARFVSQAARPYGREQLTALIGGALAFYTVGRILNQAVDNDPHWDKPFSLVHNGKEYKLRTVQGDFWSAVNEPGKYVRNRLSPLASTSIMAAEGRDRFGRKQSLGELAKDVATSNVPIPLQSWTKESDDPLAKKAFSTILKMVGVNESTERSKAEQLALDLGWHSDRAMTTEQKEHYALRRRIIEEGAKGNWKPLFDARAQGQVDQREVHQIEHDVRLGPLATRVNHFKYGDFMKVYEAATPTEKKQLDPIRLRKRADLLKKGNREAVTIAEGSE